MFILTKIADLVQIAPSDLGKDASQAIEDNINLKYANKVIQKIGLCICFYDLLSASEGLIGHGDGLVNVNGRLLPRNIMAREESAALLKEAFDVSSIQSRAKCHLLTNPSSYSLLRRDIRAGKYVARGVTLHVLNVSSNHNEQIFVWINDGQEFFFDNQESVRFRVDSEEWVDQAPIGPVKPDNPVKKEAPYRIIASMEEVGLGPCLWWDG
ncbi:dna-directed RNA polymerase iii subunit rpc8 protein [Rutstroemia sp. NJR-2017a WRK4]|nr:dna-directed RNA polymerase iii subunit rpc8 protein [Rutstroemia sp. NJR-2017a WRK4]